MTFLHSRRVDIGGEFLLPDFSFCRHTFCHGRRTYLFCRPPSMMEFGVKFLLPPLGAFWVALHGISGPTLYLVEWNGTSADPISDAREMGIDLRTVGASMTHFTCN